MLRILGTQPVWVAVISAGRPKNVGPMTNLIGPSTWYVPHNQWDDYKHKNIKLARGSDTSAVPVRNRVLTDAFELGVPCLMLDDDLKRVMKVHTMGERSEWLTDGPNIQAILTELVERLMKSEFHLAGASPTDNAYFTRRPDTTRGFVRSGVWAVKPTGLRLDERFVTKEDYDYTLQHVHVYGGVQRCDDLLFDFKQLSNEGGYSHIRTRKDKRREYDSVRLLEHKWGTKLIRRNPRRPGEVLLKFPKRTVLS
jgi:hypothetical protein